MNEAYTTPKATNFNRVATSQPSSKTDRTPMLALIIQDISARCIETAELVERHEKRLDPILAVDTPSPCGPECPPEEQLPLMLAQLREVLRRIKVTNDRLDNIYARLEV